MAHSRFSLIYVPILIENERKLAWAGVEHILVDLLAQSRFWLICNHTLIENDRKLVGSKQIGLGWLREDFG